MAPSLFYSLPFLLVGSIAVTFARYFLLSGSIYYWLCHKTARTWPRHLGGKFPDPQQLKREIYWGSLSCVVMGLVAGFVTYRVVNNRTPVYFDWAAHGTGYALLTFMVLILLHDSWFFWTHWLLHHWRWLYRHVHSAHHSSRYPSPFADLSFHPAEALIQALFIPICIEVIPLHPVVVILYVSFVSVINAIGHTGYEFFTLPLARIPWLRHISTTGSHAVHHLSPDANLGLYLCVWDRLMGSRVDPLTMKRI